MNNALDGLRFYPGTEELIKEFRTYEYKKQNNDFYIDGECTVIEVDGKKLLEKN